MNTPPVPPVKPWNAPTPAVRASYAKAAAGATKKRWQTRLAVERVLALLKEKR